MPPRPVKQLQILEALRNAYLRHGQLPDLTGLARSFGIRYPTLREHLGALESKGLIRIETRGPGRSPHITLLGDVGGVPLFGEIAAGVPVGSYPDPDAYLSLRGRPDHFALRVRGDSMADRIENGDVVVLQQTRPQSSGEICAVRVGEDETTLKYLDWRGPHAANYQLRPHNPAYPVLTVPAPDIHIDGVFRGLLRGDVIQELLVEGGG